MRRPATSLFGLALTLALAGSVSAKPWKDLAKGDGYVSAAGTITAKPAAQPAARVLSVAKAFQGLPYVWAGHDPTAGFDCSGYVYEVLRLNGYQVPRMADEQFEQTRRVTFKDLQPGDLVFFHTYLPGPSHVGFYLGSGDFIHASSAADGVVVSQMTTGYYRERFLGGGRPAGWQAETPQLASTMEPALAATDLVANRALAKVEQDAPRQEAADKIELSDSPFSRHRTAAPAHRSPQRVRVVEPELETSDEAALQNWTLVLGETVAVARLQWESLLQGFGI